MQEIFNEIRRAIEAEETIVVATIVQSADKSLIGRKLIVYAEKPGSGGAEEQGSRGARMSGGLGTEVGTPIEKAIRQKALELIARSGFEVETLYFDESNQSWSKRYPEGALRVMFESIRPRASLIICGAGHVGQAVSSIGRLLNYRVTVIDDRAEFASRQHFPDETIELIVSPFQKALREISIRKSTAIIIVTRGHQHDEACLREVLHSEAGYIGMIGSKRRVRAVFDQLIGEGYSRQQVERVHAPIGLPIGARTPEEIAVSIMAEIIQEKYQAD